MSEFLPGDIIEFIDDKTQGKVVSVVDHKTIVVDIDDGLEIPVLKEKVVVVKENTVTKIANSSNPSEISKKTPDRNFENYLYLVISNDNSDNIYDFSILNNTTDFYFFTLYRNEKEQFYGVTKGQLDSGEIYPIFHLNINIIDKFPEYLLIGLPYKEITINPSFTIKYHFRPKKEMLIKERGNTPITGQKGILIKIPFEKETLESRKTTVIFDPNATQEQNIVISKPYDVVDLHINEINSGYKEMPPHEILKYQFDYFINALEKALSMNYKKIIFIHGIGANTLKNKIYNYLQTHPSIHSFHEADIRKYGYGGVEVKVKY